MSGLVHTPDGVDSPDFVACADASIRPAVPKEGWRFPKIRSTGSVWVRMVGLIEKALELRDAIVRVYPGPGGNIAGGAADRPSIFHYR